MAPARGRCQRRGSADRPPCAVDQPRVAVAAGRVVGVTQRTRAARCPDMVGQLDRDAEAARAPRPDRAAVGRPRAPARACAGAAASATTRAAPAGADRGARGTAGCARPLPLAARIADRRAAERGWRSAPKIELFLQSDRERPRDSTSAAAAWPAPALRHLDHRRHPRPCPPRFAGIGLIDIVAVAQRVAADQHRVALLDLPRTSSPCTAAPPPRRSAGRHAAGPAVEGGRTR